jgi:hypothetical protein
MFLIRIEFVLTFNANPYKLDTTAILSKLLDFSERLQDCFPIWNSNHDIINEVAHIFMISIEFCSAEPILEIQACLYSS